MKSEQRTANRQYSIPMTGLTDIELNKLVTIFAYYDEIEQAVLYGSRAKGTYKPFSDIDITLFGVRVSSRTLNILAGDIDDLLLPYQVDLSIYSQLTNESLKSHINRVGITLYQKQ